MPDAIDVFLSHNSKDKEQVRRIAKCLEDSGLKVWLDEWELTPGQPWQEGLEQGLGTAKSIAVFLGVNGLGRWQKPEMRAALSQSVDRGDAIIPVLLPGGPELGSLPMFLRSYTCVDMRGGINDSGLHLLECGIRGIQPRSSITESANRSPNKRAWRARLRVVARPLLAAVVLLLVLYGVRSFIGTHPETEGQFDALVYDEDSPHRQGVSLRKWNALPLHSGDRIRVKVRLPKAAYCYVLWIDSQGTVKPVFPWEAGNWNKLAHDAWTDSVDLPVDSQGRPEGWPMVGKPGMESLILLVTREPLEDDFDIRSALPPLPAQPLQVSRSFVEIKNGMLLTEQDSPRPIDFSGAESIDDPLMQTQRQLWLSLRPHFDVIHSLVFAYGGGKK
ncbi:MAG: TIR domain-containing protein [Planctomycetota bacterium]|nr:TIR domain-containing protein [Planctomycetota bacterium]